MVRTNPSCAAIVEFNTFHRETFGFEDTVTNVQSFSVSFDDGDSTASAAIVTEGDTEIEEDEALELTIAFVTNANGVRLLGASFSNTALKHPTVRARNGSRRAVLRSIRWPSRVRDRLPEGVSQGRYARPH